MEEDLAFVVLDGSQLNDLDLRLDLAGDGDAIADAVISAATPSLKGLALPRSVRSAAISRMPDGFESARFEHDAARSTALEFLHAVADHLREEPIVVSVLDGKPIRVILDDEDDFAMLAEHLFTDLDVEDTGKLSKDEIKNALGCISVDLGVPPLSEMDDLLPGILKKHGAEGKGELGQAQFAELLQPVLQDLSDALAEKPITIMHNIKVVNGSKLRKILADPNLFNTLVEKMRQEWDTQSVEDVKTKRLTSALDSRCEDLGLPSADDNQAVSVLYQQILEGFKERIDGDLNEDSFQEVIKYVVEKLAAQLEATPMFC